MIEVVQQPVLATNGRANSLITVLLEAGSGSIAGAGPSSSSSPPLPQPARIEEQLSRQNSAKCDRIVAKTAAALRLIPSFLCDGVD